MAERRGRRSLSAVVAAGALAAAVLSLSPVAAAAPGQPTPVPRQSAGDGPQLPVDPEADPDRTRARAEEILERSEYQAPGPRDRSLLERVREWIGDRVPEVDRPEGDDQVVDLASLVILLAVAATAVAGLVIVLRSARRTRRGSADEPDVEVEVTPLRSARGWTDEAERCEAAGDHRGAVRARFRALTTTLVDRGIVADAPGRTAGEMRADVAERAPEMAAPFDSVARLFEEVWFGGAASGPEASRAAHDLVRRALDAAPRRAPVLAGTAPGHTS